MSSAQPPSRAERGTGFRVVVASDKFKGSLTSGEVAAAVGAGVRRVHPDATVVPIPVADGGDGTLTAAVAAGYELIPVVASGPTGEPVHTAYARLRGVTRQPQSFEGISPRVMPSPLVCEGRTRRSRGYPLERGAGRSAGGGGLAARGSAGGGGLVARGSAGGGGLVAGGLALRGGSDGRGDVAVVELADVSGLVRLPGGRPAPMTATSRGTGEVIAAAIDAGCTRIVLGIGGSASTDGGAGMIHALTGAGSLDLRALRRRLDGVEIVVACDVDNPLTGPNGAAAVYGPQKGASAEQVAELDAALTRWADHVARETGRDLRDAPGAGAAGGVGFAALALLDAELRPGIELVLELVGFHQQLAGADLVITGEGALDEQTLHGKTVAGVAEAARGTGSSAPTSTGTPVIAVCGINRLEPEQLRAAGIRAAYALTDLEPDVRKCIAEPQPLLEQLGERIAVEHLTMTRSERGIA